MTQNVIELATKCGSDNCQMTLYRGTSVKAADVDKLSMAACNTATSLMKVMQCGPSMVLNISTSFIVNENPKT